LYIQTHEFLSWVLTRNDELGSQFNEKHGKLGTGSAPDGILREGLPYQSDTEHVGQKTGVSKSVFGGLTPGNLIGGYSSLKLGQVMTLPGIQGFIVFEKEQFPEPSRIKAARFQVTPNCFAYHR
jgi:hypothetical protein